MERKKEGKKDERRHLDNAKGYGYGGKSKSKGKGEYVPILT